MNPSKGIAGSAFVASALALAMLLLALTTGVSQEYFETIRPASQYAQALVAQAAWLRVTFTLDNLFLLAYGLFFALFAVERLGRADRTLVTLMLVFALAVVALDMLENHHILAMLAAAEQGDPFGSGEIRLQQIESSFKFHLSYLALVIAAFIYPRETLLGRLVALGIGIGYPLLGVACFVAPPALAPWLSMLRVAFFVVGLAASGYLYTRRIPGATAR
jgi:hypothetical protein